MATFEQKIVKTVKDAPIEQLDKDVATALASIETSASSDIKAHVRDIVISGAKEVEAPKENVVVAFFPFRSWKVVRTIQGKLIRELEKKLKRKVVLVANRTILDKNFARKGLNFKVRPRSRTLTDVHDSILCDIVGPAEIVGRRTRISQDGNKLLKIYLDNKEREATEEKLDAYAAVYRRLTAKQATFLYQ